jgi:hypothetical protein
MVSARHLCKLYCSYSVYIAILCVHTAIFDAHHHDGGGARGSPTAVVAVDTRR